MLHELATNMAIFVQFYANFWVNLAPFFTKITGNTAAEIPVFGIDFNTGIPVLGIGIGSFNHGK